MESFNHNTMFPYNLFSNYYYWNPSNRIQCEYCGNQIYMKWNIRRCAECDKVLCAKCDTYGLCPSDFNKLPREQQEKLIKYENRNTRKMFSISLSLIILTISLIALLFLLFTANPALNDIALVILIGFLVSIGFIGIFTWYSERIQTIRRRNFLKQIGWQAIQQKILPKLYLENK